MCVRSETPERIPRYPKQLINIKIDQFYELLMGVPPSHRQLPYRSSPCDGGFGKSDLWIWVQRSAGILLQAKVLVGAPLDGQNASGFESAA